MHAIMGINLLLHRLFWHAVWLMIITPLISPVGIPMQFGFGSGIGGPSVATFLSEPSCSAHSVKLKNRKRRIFNEANFDHERDRWQAHHLQGHGERINCGDECLLFCSFYFLSMIAKHSEQRLMRKSFRPSAPFT